MKIISALIALCLLLTSELYGQTDIRVGIGIANPVTGYKTLTSSGIIYQFEATKRLNNDRWGIGLMLGWARMHNDNNAQDSFGNVRLDQIPILVTGDYELLDTKIVPYVGLGLGVSLYNFNYDTSPTSGETVFNASFSIMPRLGARMRVGEHFFPFLEVNSPLVVDGAPMGVEKADKVTGYVGIAIGTSYRL